MALRKIVQITGTADRVIALCNDGTVWMSKHWDGGEHYGWVKFKDVPQPDQERNPRGKVAA